MELDQLISGNSNSVLLSYITQNSAVNSSIATVYVPFKQFSPAVPKIYELLRQLPCSNEAQNRMKLVMHTKL